MLILGGESVRWSQTPSPLAYAVYAFINVDNCERPLMHITVETRFVNEQLLMRTPDQKRRRVVNIKCKRNQWRRLVNTSSPTWKCYLVFVDTKTARYRR